jgi:mono/diheme cytochrome c family protein
LIREVNPLIVSSSGRCVILLLSVAVIAAVRGAAAEPIDFEREIQPIFAERCLHCHGPDEAEGSFRVDRLATLLRGGDSGSAAVVPGDPETSFLVQAIRHDEPGYEMPPDEDRLSEREIGLIEQWIRGGAKTPESYGPAEETVELTHWAFQPVQRPESADGIDGFIDRRLDKNGLRRSPQADRRTLIRRLYLVLLGLPPTPERVDAFVNDSRPNAWELLVEEVLASPHYGERWATHWLDLVRFGETHGFETNRERPHAWRYRDWVVEAFNRDLPYDAFVRRQIAGDALGDPVATGFLVAGPFDMVKGKDPKLRQVQRMNELDDMINATGTTFLGLTTGCARCHNHKFDPISQVDYYAMQAVFAGVQHGDRELPLTADDKQRIAELDAEIAALSEQLQAFAAKTSDAVVAIDDRDAEVLVEPKGHAEKLVAPKPDLSRGGYTWWANSSGRDVLRYRPAVAGRYRIWISWGAGFTTHSRDARYLLETESGRREIARINQQLPAEVQGQLDAHDQPDATRRWSGLHDAGVFELSASDTLVLQGGEQGTAVTADVVIFQPIDEQTEPEPPSYRPAARARHNVETFPPREARFVRFTIEQTNRGEACIDELEVFSGQTNVALADSGAKATSSGDFVHPKHRLEHINDGRYGNSRSWIAKDERDAWVQIEFAEPQVIDRIEWARDREGQYDDRLATGYRIEVADQAGHWVRVAGSSDRWPAGGKPTAEARYRFDDFPAEQAERGRRWLDQLRRAEQQKASLEQSTLAYAGQFKQPGPTYRLHRGEPEQRREQVAPDAITVFTSLDLQPESAEQRRRVELAEWIASEENPLTARVMVNRLWQFHFGTGIVDTPSDFGRNGTPPSHPQLLDWLATEFVANDWSIKHVHRLILHSDTWKQDNKPRAEAIRVDAAARLLWRFPPRRLEAEGIRDSMLAATGVLDLRIGGPGFSGFEVEPENVRHYHPKSEYGPKDWRRMLYMTKVRQEKDVVFGAFDCPDASQTVPKRSRSTTPLQALNLLNSKFVMQQADRLVERLRRDATSTEDRIRRAWQLCFQRPPGADEIAEASRFIQQQGWVQFARALLNSNEFVFIP